jgi:hypothetical protein
MTVCATEFDNSLFLQDVLFTSIDAMPFFGNF